MNGRTWFRVHSWIGVISGLLLFVVCWSGTIATVSGEIDGLLTPAMTVSPGPERASWGEIEAAVQRAFPDARIKSFKAPAGAGSAAEIGIDHPAQQSIRVYVNPYTAEVTGHSSYFNVQRFFRSFHMNLFSGKFGHYVIYVLSLFLLSSIITPLIFYKRWWQRFFRLNTSKGLKVLVSDAHKTIGLWVIWFALIIGLTGAWYLFEGVRMDVGDGRNTWAATHRNVVIRVPGMPEDVRGQALPIDMLVAKAGAHRPDMVIKTMYWDSGLLYFEGQSEHWLVRDRANKIYLDPRDGAVVFNQYASDQPLYWRWSDTADPLHFGNFGGLVSKLIWFAFGLGLTGMTLTGAWLHAQRLVRSSSGRSSAQWAGTATAIALTIGLLAISVYGGVQEIKGYGPVASGVEQWPAMPFAVMAFIATWISTTIVAVAWWIRLLWSPRAINGDCARRAAPQLPAE